MVRNTENLTISVPKEMAEQLDALEISPSKIFQQALQDAIDRSKGMMQAQRDIASLKESLAKGMQVLADFLDQKGINFEDYNHFVYDWNKRRAENGTN